MSNTVLHTSERAYALLLELYPKKYKREFGDEMQFVFSELLNESYEKNGQWGIITLWTRICIDLSKSLYTQHIKNYNGGWVMKNKAIIRNALMTPLLLLLPFFGRKFTGEVNWSLTDYILMGFLLFFVSLSVNIVNQQVKNTLYRRSLIAGILLTFIYIWMELAVGIFTNLGS